MPSCINEPHWQQGCHRKKLSGTLAREVVLTPEPPHTPPPRPSPRPDHRGVIMDLAYTLPSLSAESSRAREATPPPHPAPWFLTSAAPGNHRESLQTHCRRPTPTILLHSSGVRPRHQEVPRASPQVTRMRGQRRTTASLNCPPADVTSKMTTASSCYDDTNEDLTIRSI